MTAPIEEPSGKGISFKDFPNNSDVYSFAWTTPSIASAPVSIFSKTSYATSLSLRSCKTEETVSLYGAI